jgi:hypothetical protein
MPILRHQDVAPGVEPPDALARFAAQHDLLLHVHHEHWELTDPPSETNWEVCSGWGSHLAAAAARQRYHDGLAAGRRLGFVGNSDNHRRNPGLGGALTGIWATGLTREAIMAALRRRRCFATDGARIAVRFWVAGAFMGQETTSREPPRIRWEVDAPQPPATITLVRDGEAIQEWRMDRTPMVDEYEDHACPAGEHYYYLAVEQATPWREWPSNVAIAHGPHGWSSPVWLRRT